MDFCRLLVVSHNPFGLHNNMGKTLGTLFSGWPKERIAQLYFANDNPESTFCKRYYRITDFDVAKTLTFKRKCGTPVERERVCEPVNQSDIRSAIVKYGKRRTPMVYFTRNLLWKLGKWENKILQDWIDGFSPDAVFFAAGDYSFSYEVACKICKDRKLPLYLYFCDDFFFGGYPAKGFLGRYNYKRLLKTATMAVKDSAGYFCISEPMSNLYAEAFGKPGKLAHTAASFCKESVLPINARVRRIIYAGNIDCGRAQQLITVGRALKACADCEIKEVQVYSAETRRELLKEMNAANGIRFCGFASEQTIQQLMGDSMFALHVESFDPEKTLRVKYSVSTKIADALVSGVCMIAIGPRQLASIKYLNENKAAFVIDKECDLVDKLQMILHDDSLQMQITENARILARCNHTQEKSQKVVYSTINGLKGDGK